MISEYIFKTLKDNIPELTPATITHVYPMTVPEGITPSLSITYNEITTNYRMGLRVATYQLTCIANSYEKCLGLSLKAERLFADMRYSANGDPIGTNVLSNKSLDVDRDSGLHIRAVDIIISSKIESEVVY